MSNQKNKIEKKFDNLAQFVSTTREEVGLSQSGLANKCNLTIDEINSIESGIETFLSTTVRQKLSKGLKVTLDEIKVYEKVEDMYMASKAQIDEIKEQIIELGNRKEDIFCPLCKNVLITRIAKMYDLEDNLMYHPKARCSKCPFQIT